MSIEADMFINEIMKVKKDSKTPLNSNSIELMCFNEACNEFEKAAEICSKYSLEAEIKQKGSCVDFLANQKSENCLIVVRDVSELEMWVEIALRIGYLNCVCTTFEGERVAEGWKNKIFAYDISSKALEIEPSNYKIILYAALSLYISKKAPSVFSAALMAKALF